MQPFVPIAIMLALAGSGCATKKAAPTFDGTDLPPDVAGNTAPSADTVALNIAALSDANVAGFAVSAVDAGTWQVPAEP